MFKQRNTTTPPYRPHIFFHLAFIMLLTFFTTGAALAESWYVIPSAEIPIRSGQGTEYKILAVVPNGLQVEIIEENDPWALVRTPGGTEGWMLRRYLSSDPPLNEIVASLQAQKAQLKEDEEKTGRKYSELLAAYSLNEQELNTCIGDRDNTKKKFQTLQKDTSDVIKIKKNLEQTSLQLQAARQKLAGIQQENNDLQRNTSVKWFLAGGGVLFIGVLIGMINRRSSKRKTSLY